MKKNKTSMIGIIITVVVLVIIVIVSNIGTGQMQPIQTVVSKVFMPFQNGFIYLRNKITNNDQRISDMEALKKENAELSDENVKLKEQVRELEMSL